MSERNLKERVLDQSAKDKKGIYDWGFGPVAKGEQKTEGQLNDFGMKAAVSRDHRIPMPGFKASVDRHQLGQVGLRIDPKMRARRAHRVTLEWQQASSPRPTYHAGTRWVWRCKYCGNIRP